MKKLLIVSIFTFQLILLSACNSQTTDTVLQKCTTLGSESIAYARANYVKLFYQFNPEKFVDTYKKIESFDYTKHRNVINTYDIAVRKIVVKNDDDITQALLSSCKTLSTFSKNLVDQSYPRAIAHKSEFSPLTNKFFSEINEIVKYDDSIGFINENAITFKQQVDIFKTALKNYKEKFKPALSS